MRYENEYEMMILNNTTPIKTFIHPEKKIVKLGNSFQFF